MRLLLVLWLLGQGVGFAVKAQDLTGQWTGSSTDNLTEKRQKIVLNIASGDSLFGGVLHYYYPETQYFRNFIVRGQFHSRDSTLSIREDSLEGSPFVLYYKRTNHKEVLEGRTPTLSIRLEKKAPPFIPLPPITSPAGKKKTRPITAISAHAGEADTPDHGDSRARKAGLCEDRAV